MNPRKQARIDQARIAAEERRKKAIVSLSVCFVRSEVMREHHDAVVLEALSTGGADAFGRSEAKQARCVAAAQGSGESLAT